MTSSMVMTQFVSQIDNCLAEEGKSILAIDSPKYNSPTFLLIEKLTKDQADMNAARSVRPLTAAAIHAASAPHVGIPTRVLYGQVFR